MKKQHDASQLANELEGSSAYFQRQPPADQEAPAHRPSQPTERSGEQTRHQPAGVTERSADPPIGQPVGRLLQKRQTQRRAFEFYRDQLETFKGWLAVEIAQGGEENMSIWAREAFDDYIAKRNGTGQPVERTTDRPIGQPAGLGNEEQ